MLNVDDARRALRLWASSSWSRTLEDVATGPSEGAHMKRSTRFKVMWTVWMSGGGLATGAIVYIVTGSLGWALVGLVASGIVLNAIGQIVIQPVRASRGNRRRPSGGPVST